MPWLVAVSENGRQRLAREFLQAQGFDCYFPLFREKRMARGHRVYVTSYLFGRYFFVSMVPAWHRVSTSFGVDDVFTHDERPALVEDYVVDEIKAREDRDGVITLFRGFKRGQRVTPKHGPLKGLIGTFERLTSSEREVAFFKLLGQLTRVEFAAGSLAVAV